MEHFVTFDNVCKYYQMGENRIAAADHVTFYIEKGRILRYRRPLGRGKNHRAEHAGRHGHLRRGADPAGRRGGERLTTRSSSPTYRRYDVGFVFQFYNLVQNLTALENVELAAEICRDPLDPPTRAAPGGPGAPEEQFPGAAFRRRAAACFHCAGAGQKPQDPALRRAHGRAGLQNRQTGAGACCRRPAASTGRTVIVITHNSALTAMADRVIRINSGQAHLQHGQRTPHPGGRNRVVTRLEKDLPKNVLRTIDGTMSRFHRHRRHRGAGRRAFCRGCSPCPSDMRTTVDEYFDRQNMHDLRIVSPLGLTDDDVAAIPAVDGVGEVMPAYLADLFVNAGEKRTSSPASTACPRPNRGNRAPKLAEPPGGGGGPPAHSAQRVRASRKAAVTTEPDR